MEVPPPLVYLKSHVPNFIICCTGSGWAAVPWGYGTCNCIGEVGGKKHLKWLLLWESLHEVRGTQQPSDSPFYWMERNSLEWPKRIQMRSDGLKWLFRAARPVKLCNHWKPHPLGYFKIQDFAQSSFDYRGLSLIGQKGMDEITYCNKVFP